MTNARSFPSLGGFITQNRDFVGSLKNRKENPDGLFSEQIFGPKQNHRCICGELNGIIHKDEVCEKCGVICGDPSIRSTQFGQIRTEFPFIKPTKQKKLIKFLGKLSNNIINPIRLDVNLDSKRYLSVKDNYTTLKIVNSLKPKKDYNVIPFRIVGIYSLYIALKFAADFLKVDRAIDFFDDGYITDIIKVLPPDLRMYSLDTEKDQVITPPINKAYTSLLNAKSINVPILEYIKLDEIDWLEQIKISYENGIVDQEIFPTQLTEYDTKAANYQTYVNQVYDYVYTSLSGKPGLIRNSVLGKTLEFSARTVITVDPSLLPYQVKMSKKILKKLWMPYMLHYLIEVKGFEATRCFETYMLNELENQEEFDEMFNKFLVWFYDY